MMRWAERLEKGRSSNKKGWVVSWATGSPAFRHLRPLGSDRMGENNTIRHLFF